MQKRSCSPGHTLSLHCFDLHPDRETHVYPAETEENMIDPKKVRRGEIYFADIPKVTRGSVQAGTRPVLITQNNWLNERAPTVIVATVTSVIKRLDLKTHVLLPMIKGLPKRSMVMAEQRYTLDKQCLRQYRCTLPSDVMKEVDRAIRYAEKGKNSIRPFRKGFRR